MRIEKSGKIIIVAVVVAVILVGAFSALFFLTGERWHVPGNQKAFKGKYSF